MANFISKSKGDNGNSDINSNGASPTYSRGTPPPASTKKPSFGKAGAKQQKAEKASIRGLMKARG